MSEDTIRILRVVEYIGPRSVVEEQVKKSLHGERKCPNNLIIRAVTVNPIPDVVDDSWLGPRGEPTKKFWEVEIDAITPDQWNEMSKLERVEWAAFWRKQGYAWFGCTICRYPTGSGTVGCRACCPDVFKKPE